MGRFAASKYKPVNDSSPEYAGRDLSNVLLRLPAREDGTLGCPCGCMTFPASPKSTFKMGHDARLKGILIRAHLTGTQIVIIAGDRTMAPKPAMAVAKQHDWEHYLIDAETRRDAKRPSVHVAIGTVRRVKVGRWFYEGTVKAVRRNSSDALVWDINYTDKKNVERVATVPAGSAPVV